VTGHHHRKPDRLLVYFHPAHARRDDGVDLLGLIALLEQTFVGKSTFKEFRMGNLQIVSNATKGLVLGIVETLAATGQVFPSAGPYTVDVTDPNADANGQNGTVTIVAGTPDQKTPTIFRPSGNGKTGTIAVKVTDTSNNLVGSASFDVVAPPPPPVADTLTVGFTPEA
jgi:hypothetical protein